MKLPFAPILDLLFNAFISLFSLLFISLQTSTFKTSAIFISISNDGPFNSKAPQKTKGIKLDHFIIQIVTLYPLSTGFLIASNSTQLKQLSRQEGTLKTKASQKPIPPDFLPEKRFSTASSRHFSRDLRDDFYLGGYPACRGRMDITLQMYGFFRQIVQPGHKNSHFFIKRERYASKMAVGGAKYEKRLEEEPMEESSQGLFPADGKAKRCSHDRGKERAVLGQRI